MLFTKRGKGIGTLVGPVFEREIDKAKKTFFLTTKVHIVEENAFKVRYSERYINHIKENWCDKIYCYLMSNADWIGTIYTLDRQRSFLNEFFEIIERCDDQNELIALEVRFSLSCNPFYSARMLYDLKQILPIVVIEGHRFFRSKDGMIYNGTRGVSRYLAEQIVGNMCLT